MCDGHCSLQITWLLLQVMRLLLQVMRLLLQVMRLFLQGNEAAFKKIYNYLSYEKHRFLIKFYVHFFCRQKKHIMFIDVCVGCASDVNQDA